MKTKLFLVCIIFTLSFFSCTKDQLTTPNEEERILTVSYRYRFEGCAGCGYSDTKLIFDSTYTTFQKRLGFDTNNKILPNIDTTFNISSQMWLKIKSSFNMDSVMLADTIYNSYVADEPEKTIEIFTTQRHKKIIFFSSNLPKIGFESQLECIDSLDRVLFKLRWEL